VREKSANGEVHSMTRVLVVADFPLVAAALATAIDLQPDLECVGIASHGKEAIDHLESPLLDVVLLDARLSGQQGIDAARRITSRRPDTPVLILTEHEDSQLATLAASSAAYAVLSGRSSVSEVLATIRAAGRRPRLRGGRALRSAPDAEDRAGTSLAGQPTRGHAPGDPVVRTDVEDAHGPLYPEVIAGRLGLRASAVRRHKRMRRGSLS